MAVGIAAFAEFFNHNRLFKDFVSVIDVFFDPVECLLLAYLPVIGPGMDSDKIR